MPTESRGCNCGCARHVPQLPIFAIKLRAASGSISVMGRRLSLMILESPAERRRSVSRLSKASNILSANLCPPDRCRRRCFLSLKPRSPQDEVPEAFESASPGHPRQCGQRCTSHYSLCYRPRGPHCLTQHIALGVRDSNTSGTGAKRTCQARAQNVADDPQRTFCFLRPL